jgi:glycine cleavage system H protein
MNPKEYKYTQEHEWIHSGTGNKSKIGLTDYAQTQLGDLVYLDLPEPDTEVEQSKKMAEIESVKAVADFFAPVSGKVLESNQSAIDDPALVNQDPFGEGWLVELELSNPSELDTLMDSDKYDELVAKLETEAEEASEEAGGN